MAGGRIMNEILNTGIIGVGNIGYLLLLQRPHDGIENHSFLAEPGDLILILSGDDIMKTRKQLRELRLVTFLQKKVSYT